jgi:glycogen operon protein
VSYEEKHNEANGEDNRDGESHNRSFNCGVEGDTEDPAVLECRRRQQRNFLTTLFVSQGVPMLLGGDEIGRTQDGNNNAYCQDNELSWFDWDARDESLLEFTRGLVALRKRHPIFRRRRWFHGRPIRGTVDIGWFKPDGNEMSEDDWNTSFARAIGIFLNGEAIPGRDARGQRLVDDSFLLLFDAGAEPVEWTLPTHWPGPWQPVLDTTDGVHENGAAPAGPRVTTRARSVVLLRRPRTP